MAKTPDPKKAEIVPYTEPKILTHIREDHRDDLCKEIPVYSVRMHKENYLPYSMRFKVPEPHSVVPILQYHYEGKTVEEAVAIYLDSGFSIIGLVVISVGLPTVTVIPISLVLTAGLALAAEYVIIAHNHPSGPPTPSKPDIEATQRLRRACRLVNMTLLDHVIIGEEGFTSMKTNGLMEPPKKKEKKGGEKKGMAIVIPPGLLPFVPKMN